MDPEGEQEIEDNRLDEFVQQEEFDHLDPEFLEQSPEDKFEKQFRPIEVRPLELLCIDARQKDFFQRKVIELGVRHARHIVKARKGKNKLPSAPLHDRWCSWCRQDVYHSHFQRNDSIDLATAWRQS